MQCRKNIRQKKQNKTKTKSNINNSNSYNNNNVLIFFFLFFLFLDKNNLFKNIKPTPFTRMNTNKKMYKLLVKILNHNHYLTNASPITIIIFFFFKGKIYQSQHFSERFSIRIKYRQQCLNVLIMVILIAIVIIIITL